MKVLVAKVRSSYLYPRLDHVLFRHKTGFSSFYGKLRKRNRPLRGTTVTCTGVTQSLPVRKILWNMEAVRLNYWGSCPGFPVYWGNYHCTAFLFWPLSSCIVGSLVSILAQRAGSAVPIHEDRMSFSFEKRPLGLQQNYVLFTSSAAGSFMKIS